MRSDTPAPPPLLAMRCPKCHLAFEGEEGQTRESLAEECGIGHHADTVDGCPEMIGEPLYWNGAYRVTDKTLARMANAPSTFAAWTLRGALRELQERRAADQGEPHA